MTPKQFEHYVCDQFIMDGYTAETTSFSNDYGVDIIAVKENERLAIQVKMYGASSRKINRQMVMELHGAKDYFDCNSAVIATDGIMMKDAEDVAEKLKIRILYFNKAELKSLSTPSVATSFFDEIWEHIYPLKGKQLILPNGQANKITNVDWSGIERITSNGKPGIIKIEIFKYAVSILTKEGIITRDEINQNYIGRASSGVILILSAVPYFKPCKKPTGLIYLRPA